MMNIIFCNSVLFCLGVIYDIFIDIIIYIHALHFLNPIKYRQQTFIIIYALIICKYFIIFNCNRACVGWLFIFSLILLKGFDKTFQE